MTVRRAVIAWAGGFALLIAAFGVTVAALNGTVYSAHGFVSSYLDALARHDATTARALPGVRAPAGVSTALLTADALGSIRDIRLVSDTRESGGRHTVRYSYTLGSTHGTTDFAVQNTGAFLGLFSRWSFSTSPLATVSVTVLHDPGFRVNGTELTNKTKAGVGTPAGATPPQTFVVFAPGRYSVDHRSTFLTATAVDVDVTTAGSVTPVQVDVQANRLFVSEVRSELDSYLTSCAKQTVLFPTSCPFGKSFNNRVVGTPKWSIVANPTIAIVPDGTSGNWLIPYTTARAHLTVEVQSLLTGATHPFDDDVPFPVSFRITIGANNHLSIVSLAS